MTEIIHIFCDYHAFDIVSIKMQKKKKMNRIDSELAYIFSGHWQHRKTANEMQNKF